MSDNLVPRWLREMRTMIGEIQADMVDGKLRVSTPETRVGGAGASGRNRYASLSVRLDRVLSDMRHIKHQLDIVDVSAE